MSTFLSFTVRTLVLLSVCSAVFGVPNRPRVKRLDEIVERAEDVEKRGICYDDDTLESFKEFIIDSAPYCSSLLGIEDFTSTVPQISRTTTSVLTTSYTGTVTVTATVASVTLFSTTYVPTLLRRGDPPPTSAFYEANPYAYSVIADNTNASIASSYYSACSCLHLTPSTVDSFAVISSTRTISGIDSEETTDTVYVTTGTSTLVLTRAGNPGSPPTATVSSTVSVIPTSLPTTNTTITIRLSTATSSVPSASQPTPSFNSSLTLSNTFASSGTRPTFAPTSNRTSFSVPSLTPTISANSTTRLPPVTGPSSGFPPLPTGNMSSTYLLSSASPHTSRPTSGFPSPSANSTSRIRPTSGPFTTNRTVSSEPSYGYPTPPANGTVTSSASAGSPMPTGTGGVPYPLNSTIFPPPVTNTVTSTAIPSNSSVATPTSATTNPSSAATTSAAASATPPLDISNCPGLNGTLVTLSDGQEFAVVCETEFSGPVDIGLDEPTFQKCIEDCGIANNGFSAVRCRGVTYDTGVESGPNCNFKNAAGLLSSTRKEWAVSAVLIHYDALNATTTPAIALPTPSQTQARLKVVKLTKQT